MSALTGDQRRRSGRFSRALVGCVISSKVDRDPTPSKLSQQKVSSKGDMVDSEWRYSKDYPREENRRPRRSSQSETAMKVTSTQRAASRSSTPFVSAALQAMKQRSKSLINIFSSGTSQTSKMSTVAIATPGSSKDFLHSSPYSRRRQIMHQPHYEKKVAGISSLRLSKQASRGASEHEICIRPANVCSIRTETRPKEAWSKERKGFSMQDSLKDPPSSFQSPRTKYGHSSPAFREREVKGLKNTPSIETSSEKKSQEERYKASHGGKNKLTLNSSSSSSSSSSLSSARQADTEDDPLECDRNFQHCRKSKAKRNEQNFRRDNGANTPNRHSIPSSPSYKGSKRVSSYSRSASYYIYSPGGKRNDSCVVASFSEEISSNLVGISSRNYQKHDDKRGPKRDTDRSQKFSYHSGHPPPARIYNPVYSAKRPESYPIEGSRSREERPNRNEQILQRDCHCRSKLANLKEPNSVYKTPSYLYKRSHSYIEGTERIRQDLRYPPEFRGHVSTFNDKPPPNVTSLSTFGNPVASSSKCQGKSKQKIIFSEHPPLLKISAMRTSVPISGLRKNKETRPSTRILIQDNEPVTTHRRPTTSSKPYLETCLDTPVRHPKGTQMQKRQGVYRSSSMASIPSRLAQNLEEMPEKCIKKRPLSAPRSAAEYTEIEPVPKCKPFLSNL